VKLCDVFDDGTSALVSRGTLDLAFRDGVHGRARELVPGETYDVVVDLDACAYAYAPGQVLRVSIAGADWPNTVAAPAPVTLTVAEARVELPILDPVPGDYPVPELAPGADRGAENAEDVQWVIRDDVLGRVTSASTGTVSSYSTPHGGTAREEYRGEVTLNRLTCDQHARAETTFDLAWPGIAVRVHSVMDIDITEDGYDVSIEAHATRDGAPAGHRKWAERIPR
jgi:uncharacterized protein